MQIVAPAQARLFFDPNDSALTGANVVPLDSTIGLTDGMQFFQTTIDGVEITIETTNPNGFFAQVFAGQVHFISFFPDGVNISFDPPVGAAGALYAVAECFAQAEFVGTAATEQFATQFGEYGIFIGAADIGDISELNLNGGCFAASWAELRFVPSTGAPPPTDEADLVMNKTGPGSADQSDSPLVFDLNTTNLGPDPANNTQVIDFIPAGMIPVSGNPPVVELPAAGFITQQDIGTLANGEALSPTLTLTVPSFELPLPHDYLDGPIGAFNCNSRLINVALATSSSLDFNGSNNRDAHVIAFDNESRIGFTEICDNAIDDNCNGKVDCGESSCRFSFPGCMPPPAIAPDYPFDPCDILFPPPPGLPCLGSPPTDPDDRPNDQHTCHVPRGVCGGVTVPAYCCDPATWSNPSLENIERLKADCGVSFPGCTPMDPNFKEASPGVNVTGFGFITAGETIQYTLHYENVGNADAHDVLILDTLSTDLDDATLAINDGGTYEAAQRLITWVDPVVPPATPRSVSFSIDVGDDALPGTRIPNQATVVFPDADPPSRTDTNVVEHLVPDPDFPIEANLLVLECEETAPGSNEWTVRLGNHGWGYAYNVKATILNPPPSVQVIDGMASFAHPDDADPSDYATVVPLAYTPSMDTVSFVTQTPFDPCDALLWRIEYQTPDEQMMTMDVQRSPDDDTDAVGDDRDNCLGVYNPTQLDSDNDGFGDACDGCPGDEDKTMPGICGCDVADVDSDNDGVFDCDDVCDGFNDLADADTDGVPDGCDNCPDDANPDQSDTDGDEIGDVCDSNEEPPGDICGDLNGDEQVDVTDFMVLLASFGRSVGQPGYNEAADLDSDGTVTFVDYQMWLVCYQEFLAPQ